MAVSKNPLKDIIDLELAEKIAAYLVSTKSPILQKLSVQVFEGKVTLRGNVGTHFEKQLALLCYERVPGIVQLVDEIVVAEARKFVPAPAPPR